MRSISLKIIALCGFCVLLGCNNEPEKPNVIFFIVDDMYPEMFNNIAAGVTTSGAPANLTPAIDRLALEGVWLDNMKVVSPVCTPSRYSCLTGNYASRATNESFLKTTSSNDGQKVVQWNSFIVPGGQKTMGHYFKELGYNTGFVGKNHVIESSSQEKKYPAINLAADPYDSLVKKRLEDKYEKLQEDIRNCGFDYADALYHNNPNWLGVRKLASHNMDWITEKGLEFIDQNKSEPFMLYFATTLPHGPHIPERSWMSDRRITPKGILEKAPDVLPRHEGIIDKYYQELMKGDPGLEPTYRNVMSLKVRLRQKGLRDREKENLLWLDDALSALFAKLEQEELLDNTIIVFFNDHGQELKGSLYEKGINSEAFIWRSGGFKVGNVLETPVSNVDFLPTLLEYAGYKGAADFDGYSFKSALEKKKYKERAAMYHELGYARAIVKDGFKYYTVRYPESGRDLSYKKRKAILDEYNRFKERNGRPVINTDPNKPFGQLVMVPGGDWAECEAYTNMPHFFEPDQFYDLTNDPEEKHNLIDDPKYADKIKELKEELKKRVNDLESNYEI
ncbi:sulfatase-like hydrolase/transferase [Aureisphaera galaxeae]|uniref:sulfatase family protein n=1 Tax=Aureisphaera galaxeae TaxID=1538023 RepID=UPI00234FB7F6|nr:sulfatase-like hydrolase/transferase [Aureisphaera galaxeae]MDC8003406.1 sulfatase-like hydrolase/transferase [Aureisphaera galaxeae]